MRGEFADQQTSGRINSQGSCVPCQSRKEENGQSLVVAGIIDQSTIGNVGLPVGDCQNTMLLRRNQAFNAVANLTHALQPLPQFVLVLYLPLHLATTRTEITCRKWL